VLDAIDTSSINNMAVSGGNRDGSDSLSQQACRNFFVGAEAIEQITKLRFLRLILTRPNIVYTSHRVPLDMDPNIYDPSLLKEQTIFNNIHGALAPSSIPIPGLFQQWQTYLTRIRTFVSVKRIRHS